MISSIGVTDDNTTPWPHPVPPPAPPPGGISAASGTGRSAPAWITGADTAPADVALVLLRGADGLLRLRPADITVPAHTHPEPWGDRVAFAATDPDPGSDAPVGAVYVNAATGRIYRRKELQA